MTTEKKIFTENMKDRTKALAVEVFNLCISLKSNAGMANICKMLMKEVTAAGTYYRTASRARSIPEFINKIHLAIEKADACIFLLEILEDLKILSDDKPIKKIKKEAKDIINILNKTKSATYKTKKSI